MKLLCSLLLQILFFYKLCHAYTKNSNFLSISSPHFIGALITDLESTTSSNFLIEASNWTLSSAVCPSCNQTSNFIPNSCISQPLIYGGPNILGPSGGNSLNQYFQRQYTGVTIAGSAIGIQLEFYVFSSIKFFTTGSGPDQIFYVRANTMSYSSYAYSQFNCSVNYATGSGVMAGYVYWILYRGLYSVSGTSTLTLQIQNKLSGPSTSNFFGFRNIKIYTGGINGQGGTVLDNWNTFPCLKYYFWNGTVCELCHAACATCYGEQNSQCWNCRSGFYNYNNRTCLASCNAPFYIQSGSEENYCYPTCSTGFYWFHNNSCTNTCPSPLVQSIDANNLRICSNPCYYNVTYLNKYRYPDQTCGSTCLSPFVINTPYLCLSPCANLNDYVYTNGTCASSCNAPLTSPSSKGVKFCQSSCPTQYLYANGSCSAGCSSPLVKREIPDIKFCINPCPVSQFLYPNSTCKSTCPSPLLSRSEPGAKYCWSPCNSTQYLYANGSCSSVCLSPLIKQEGSDIKLCLNPCSDPVNLYLYSNSTCKSSCLSPLLSRSEPGVKYCYNPCSSTQFLYANSTCKSTCPSPLISRTEPEARFCFNPCTDPDNQYLFPNGTCKSTCPSPLLSRSEPGVKYCWSPCLSTQYLFANGSCLACPSPLVKKEDPDIKLCVNPCTDPVNPYLFPNGTCKSSCPSPLSIRSEPGTQYCYSPCLSTQYLYANGSCLACPSPLVKKEDPDVKLCFNPCTDPASPYLYPNGTCKSSCPSPLLTRSEPGTQYCFSPCSSTQFLYPNSTCLSSCPAPLASRTESVAQYCYNPCLDPVTQFLYSDGSCKSSCTSPLLPRSEHGTQYCYNPCSMSQYLYPNSTCQSTCLSPLEEKVDALGRYCKNPCSLSQYLYPGSTCKSTCPSPLLSRSEPDVQYCWSPCLMSQFLYPNSSCQSGCNFPLAKRSGPEAKYCYNPCDLNTEYLFDNGDCSGQCNPPLLIEVDLNFVQYCHNPCYADNTFLYSNGSCMTTCPDPLNQKTVNGVKYCFNPCPSASDYLYPDKSCSAQCPSPFLNRQEPMANYCFSPCDDYLYKNGSCLPTCPFPYVKSQSYNMNQCSPPCEDPQKEYFYEADQVCKAACTSPYDYKIVNEVKVCFKTVTDKEEAQKIVSSVQSQRKITEAGMKAASVLNSGSPSFSWLAGQDTMLFAIRYINLNYTSKLKMVFFLQGSNPFDFTIEIDMPKALENKLKDRELPEIFERYEVHSNFLSSSWDMLSSGLLILVIILALSVAQLFTGKYARIDRLLAGVLASLKWNTLLMVILGSFGPMYFDASLQLQVSSLESFWETLSLGLAIVMILIGLAILALGVKIVNDIWKSRKEESCLEKMEKKWKNFELLFEGYKRSSLASFGCMVIFLSRTLIFNLIIVNLYNYPLMQGILVNLMSFVMVGYMVSQRSLKDTLEFVQLLLNEILVVIANLCALIIAIMDKANIQGHNLRNDVCDTIIIAIYVFTSLNLAFFVVQMLLALFSFYKLLKCLKAKGQLNPRGILNALLFENKGNATKSTENKNNVPKHPIQVQLQRKPIREIPHNQSGFIENQNLTQEINITTNTIQQMNETENRQEISGIFIHRRHYRPRIIKVSSQNIGQNSSFFDFSATEMLPSEGLVETLNIGQSLDRTAHLTLRNNKKGDSLKVPSQENRDLGGLDTISQYRKMKNYLRRNQGQEQHE